MGFAAGAAGTFSGASAGAAVAFGSADRRAAAGSAFVVPPEPGFRFVWFAIGSIRAFVRRGPSLCRRVIASLGPALEALW
ncbi:MAG: hypothetical protein U1F45_17765 [Burkholderiales bacterium]